MTWPRRIAATAALTVALLLVTALGPSHADANQARASTVVRAVAVAQAYWAGTTPVCAPVHVLWPADDPLLADISLMGYAYVGPFDNGDPYCTIVLQRDTPWKEIARSFHANGREFLCAVIVHEAGHLAGRRHTTRGIMTAQQSTVPRACRNAF